MNVYYNLFFDGIKKVINVMQDFEIFSGVSLFSFLIALTVMTIVITYLVNVARSPGVRSVSSERADSRRKARADIEAHRHKQLMGGLYHDK